MRHDLTARSVVLDARERLDFWPVAGEFLFIQSGFLSSGKKTDSGALHGSPETV